MYSSGTPLERITRHLLVVAEIVVAAVGQHLMAAQPDLRDVLKAAVLVDLLRGDMQW